MSNFIKNKSENSNENDSKDDDNNEGVKSETQDKPQRKRLFVNVRPICAKYFEMCKNEAQNLHIIDKR